MDNDKAVDLALKLKDDLGIRGLVRYDEVKALCAWVIDARHRIAKLEHEVDMLQTDLSEAHDCQP